MKRSELKPNPERVREFQERGRRSSAESLERSRGPLGLSGHLKVQSDGLVAETRKKKRPSFTPASKAQRAKVRDEGCAMYRYDLGCIGAVQPAHVVARSKGGCDAADCVLALCEFHHRQFDDGHLDLLRVVSASWPLFRAECQHALEHLNPVELVEQLANDRVTWRGKEAA